MRLYLFVFALMAAIIILVSYERQPTFIEEPVVKDADITGPHGALTLLDSLATPTIVSGNE